MDKKDEYCFSSAQWTDFTEMSSDSQHQTTFFDHYHEELETPYDVRQQKENHGRMKNKVKKIPMSPVRVDVPRASDLLASEIESTFISDIDKISMTPIKVTSPRMRNKEPVVLQELSVNEVLSSAIEGIEIASSTIKKRRAPQNLHTTVCPSSVDNSKTPGRRVIRVTHSMDFKSSSGLTPAAKAASTPRVYARKLEITKEHIEEVEASKDKMTTIEGPQQCSNFTDDEQTKENNINLAACSSTVTNFKTPKKPNIRISSVINFKAPTGNSPDIPKMEVLVPTLDKISKCDTLTKKITDIKNIIESSKTMKDDSKENEDMNPTERITASALIIEKEHEEQMKVAAMEQPLLQPERIKLEDEDDDDDFEPQDDFQMEMKDDDELFVVHQSQHAEMQPIRQKQPTLLTNPARRHSILNNYRRRSNKYISLAEAVSSYQRRTPTRFRSCRPQPGRAPKAKPHASTRTIPVSPALQSKTRVRRNNILSQAQREELEMQQMRKPQKQARPAPKAVAAVQASTTTIPISPALHKTRARKYKVLSQAEREELEVQNMRKHQVHARPVPKAILEGPVPLKPVLPKRVTVPQPFHLTETKKASQGTASTSTSSAAAEKDNQSKGARPRKTVYAPTNDGTMENTEIRHFGIPTTANVLKAQEKKKKVTQPQAFSLEDRNKEFLRKKEQRLKALLDEEMKKMKVDFHARPVPAAVKNPPAAPHRTEAPKETLQKPTSSHVRMEPFSFENRDRNFGKKKEDLRKKIEEDEKKARVFHANPAPTFKPVSVRSTSRENLKVEKAKSSDSLKPVRTDARRRSVDDGASRVRGRSADNRQLQAANGMRPCGVSADNFKNVGRAQNPSTSESKENLAGKQNNQQEAQNPTDENAQPNVPAARTTSAPAMPALKQQLKALPIQLHSDKRAKLRREYDEMMRHKLEENEQRRKREQQAKLAREQQEIAELRKKAEVKARPMPVYKPLVIVKSTKPVTEPESPAWSKPKH